MSKLRLVPKQRGIGAKAPVENPQIEAVATYVLPTNKKRLRQMT